MVFGTLEQLEALMESLGIFIGHCHGLSDHTIQTDSRGIWIYHELRCEDS